MNLQNELPNQKVTWGAPIEEFTEWKQRLGCKYASENTEFLAYLSDQLKIEGASLIGVQFNHPVLSLLSHMNEFNNRMQELLLAYLSIVVLGDIQPSKKLIAGQRLTYGLHPDYVASTHCYAGRSAMDS
jgi:hypothetical protein